MLKNSTENTKPGVTNPTKIEQNGDPQMKSEKNQKIAEENQASTKENNTNKMEKSAMKNENSKKDGPYIDFEPNAMKINFEEELKKAESGDADAMLCIADSLPQNDEEALRWYLKAAEAGNYMAPIRLFWVYRKRGGSTELSIERVVEILRDAAEGGNADAQYTLACYYLDGKDTERDIQRGIHWLYESQKQGQYEGYELILNIERFLDTEFDQSPTVEWKCLLDENTYCDSYSHVPKATDEKKEPEELHRINKKYYVKFYSQQLKDQHFLFEVSKEDAARWIILNDYDLPEDLMEYEEIVSE